MTLTFAHDAPDHDGFLHASLEWLAGMLGVPIQVTPERPTVDLYYGNDDARPCRLRVPRVADGYAPDQVPGLPEGDDAPHDAPFPFDWFEATRLWLTDAAHDGLPGDAFDVHERLLPERSLQHRLGLLEVPVVNAYTDQLRTWLEARGAHLGRPFYLPEGKRAVVMLSHDVDMPIDPTDPLHPLWLTALAARNGRATRAARFGLEVARAAWAMARGRRDRHDVFAEVLEAEWRAGVRSTFFFAVRSSAHARAHTLDVPYDLSRPVFRRAFALIRAYGAEVGLHLSYNARASHARMRRELETLRRLSGRDVIGNRHHFWHMRRPFWRTLDDHGRAGLSYDSSIAFNGRPGYRLGVAWPFHPWSPLSKRRVESLQIPSMAMDGAFFYNTAPDVPGTLARLEGLLATLKRYQGVAAIDWHVRTSWPGAERFAPWGEAYLGLLELIAADPEIEALRGEEILELSRAAPGVIAAP